MTSNGRQYVVTTEVTVTVHDEHALFDTCAGSEQDAITALRLAVDPRALFTGIAGIEARRGAMRVRPAWPGPA
ncbi:hypothetical protein [Actinokineospora sp. NBRC 105648]|uniref:hypothetical protein n=1 Tax=Actinokineospora sp. NBRC 105648 TaxID=3032206 RepID=UPI00255689DC|nr:hypothetical protein [Actinokineospora sp. NBRC 105648]